VQLEFEKVLVNLLMLQKKKYVSIKFESPTDEGKMDPHGIEIVRRDNAKFLVKLQTDFFERLIRHGDVPGACNIVETYTRRLTSGQVNLDDLIISKKYSKAKYKNVPIHVYLNNKLRRRCAATAYHCGDRIPYVVVSGGAPITERGEDPAYVREHNVPVDLNYYFTTMVEKPMIRLLEQVIGKQQTRTLLGRGRVGSMDRFVTRKRDNKDMACVQKQKVKKTKQTKLSF
jgi:DNA polymerase elongation subunit (family B)